MSSYRNRSLQRLQLDFDLLVIGGGVNGLGIAWDAADRGLSVLVIDKGDWGSGTSSWSSRMIHGGLKYLDKLEVGLVRESLRDREWLLRRAPHLVAPLRFALPFYRNNSHHRFALRAGMVLYDVLSFDKSLPVHRTYGRRKTAALLPGLSPDGLQGSAVYYDAQVEYAERLSVEIMLAARAAGATTLNHAESTRLRVERGRVVGASVRDMLTGTVHEVAARFTVNVAGPWADSVLTGSPLADERLIGGTKGTHLVVEPFPGSPHCAMYYEALSDGRPLMVIPWLGRYLIGSTDERFEGDPGAAAAGQEEIDYILAETNRLFPAANLSEDSILYTYTGVRPLPFSPSGDPGDITRRHILHDHRPRLDGLLSVVGGKLTTFRTLAEHAVDQVGERLGRKTSSRTRGLGLPGSPPEGPGEFRRAFERESGLPAAEARRLARVYGARARQVAALIASSEALSRTLAPSLRAGEVVFAIREEEAAGLADVLARRTMIGLEPDLGQGAMDAVAAVCAAELDWDDAETARQKAAYLAYLRRFGELEPRPAV
ncbi:glycerol-3-phosphate dehydrogenase/oxidase [Nonomuraea basaltis]|uniref:glycerol-3-phosphate dehydrogenase/oxidase n=1 Tax=Nonomuraea basaltis TaxID=2495887 RepID=UPI00110C589D|nr:glycerol-3-phosphate dehydrogenase/oxidase [Nonomuraea basaltis]TMR96892.1 glycerol-3-phosphate dehydrogenase/oxidase [Nonomuraea basaltis]